MNLRFEVFPSRWRRKPVGLLRWYWRIVRDGNNETLCVSEAYVAKHNAMRTVHLLNDNMSPRLPIRGVRA